MMKRIIPILLLTFSLYLLSSAQVRIRVLTGNNPGYLFFRVVSGRYTINTYTSDSLSLSQGDMAVFALYNGKVAIKTRLARGITADSVFVRPGGNTDRFSLSTSENSRMRKVYSGDLQCLPDMGSLIFINVCDVESYVAGVVNAEGGNGKRIEYFKTQAVITRTYTYRNFMKHILDRYNLCDDTHCQVFNGITDDSLIIKAVNDTRDLVIATPDSNLIISAFHSNCGGETSPSDFVWPSKQDYLVKVIDPYCIKSRNAAWTKVLARKSWIDMLVRNGYRGPSDTTAVFDFRQLSRVQNYATGSFSLPFSIIRKEFNLRSAWFSVKTENDSLILSGRGNGHGIGLCQEGAMVMAAKGAGYADIIGFYYQGVKLLRIGDVKKSEEEPVSAKIKQGN